MDTITYRPYHGQADHQRVEELLLAYRAATRVDIYPTIWRFHLLLTSRVWDPVLDTCVWEDIGGRVLGFAMLWRRRVDDHYLVLEQFVHPLHATVALADTILSWATQRAMALAVQQATSITLVVNGLDPAFQLDAPLQSYGFIPTPDPNVYNAYFVRSLEAALPQPLLPERYTIRSLRDDELEAYQALYAFAAVTSEHRRTLLAHDDYRHLVVVSPGGTLAAYCECSIYRPEWQLSRQRIGWIDYVGTKPEYQHQGLGRAILLASLRQLQLWGAEKAMLITISTNTPAVRLYQAVGFAQQHIPERPSYELQITA
jgi:mycothiol synthase